MTHYIMDVVVGPRKHVPTDWRGELTLHLDLEPFPHSVRVERDAVHECPKVDQATAIVLRLGVAAIVSASALTVLM